MSGVDSYLETVWIEGEICFSDASQCCDFCCLCFAGSVFAMVVSFDIAQALAVRFSGPRSTAQKRRAAGGVGSAFDLDRKCGFRLRQVRTAELLLGVNAVVRVAYDEFGLRVPREIARRWLDIWGRSACMEVLYVVHSAEQLERCCGRLLSGCGFVQRARDYSKKIPALHALHSIFPHVRVTNAVLLSWVRKYSGPRLIGLKIPHLFAVCRKQPCLVSIRSYEELLSRCGPALDVIFEAHPGIGVAKLLRVFRGRNLGISVSVLSDYVVLRSVCAHASIPQNLVPDALAASLMADMYLYGENICGAQRCAALRGVNLSQYGISKFKRRMGRPQKFTIAEISCESPDVFADYRCDLYGLLAEHLSPHGVHRVCEVLLARRNVYVSFEDLQTFIVDSLDDFAFVPLVA